MSNILTAYFSASGVTKSVAEKVAAAAHSDLYEITPETPYTQADLNWQNPKSRSSVEMNEHPEFRPAMSGIIDVSGFDTILIGFPIWWYVAPTIINTFLESADFSGKQIILFATSGSSGMGKTTDALKPSAPGAKFTYEKRFPANVSQDAVDSWIKSMNL